MERPVPPRPLRPWTLERLDEGARHRLVVAGGHHPPHVVLPDPLGGDVAVGHHHGQLRPEAVDDPRAHGVSRLDVDRVKRDSDIGLDEERLPLPQVHPLDERDRPPDLAQTGGQGLRASRHLVAGHRRVRVARAEEHEAGPGNARDHAGPGPDERERVQPVPDPAAPEDDARVGGDAGMATLQAGPGLRRPGGKADPHDVDEPAQALVVAVGARVHPAVRGEDPQPEVALPLAAAQEEVPELDAFVGDAHGVAVDPLLRLDALVEVVVEVLEHERVVEVHHEPGRGALEEPELGEHVPGHHGGVGAFHQDLQAGRVLLVVAHEVHPGHVQRRSVRDGDDDVHARREGARHLEVAQAWARHAVVHHVLAHEEQKRARRAVHLGHGARPSGEDQRGVVSHDVARREAGRGALQARVGEPLVQAGSDRSRTRPPAVEAAARFRDPREVGDRAAPGAGVRARGSEPAAPDVAAQLAEVLRQVGAHELPRLGRREQLEGEAQPPVHHPLQLGGREPLAVRRRFRRRRDRRPPTGRGARGARGPGRGSTTRRPRSRGGSPRPPLPPAPRPAGGRRWPRSSSTAPRASRRTARGRGDPWRCPSPTTSPATWLPRPFRKPGARMSRNLAETAPQ